METRIIQHWPGNAKKRDIKMKNFLKNGGLVLVGSVAGLSAASAAVPASVTTAIADATTDVATIGGAVLVVMISIATFIWLRKPMH